MVTLVILLILITVILLASIHNKIADNRETLTDIQEQLDKIAKQLRGLQQPIKQETTGKIITPVKDETAIPVIKSPVPVEEPTPATAAVKQPVPEPVPEPKKMIPPAPRVQVPEEIDERKLAEPETWLQRNPDLERFIGENIANKIGIAVLVLGIAFFVKYAIDKNWINETGRVIIGLVSGGILIGIAHYIRNSYRSFSSVLLGGGLTVFYFTIAFAFHQYQLIGQQAAFLIMVVITAFAVVLSLYYNRQELAILATIGGFITPFLVTTGQENYIALFVYLCILNTGLMVLSWFKRWPAINSIALFFTTIIYGGWLIKRIIVDEPETLPYRDALLFATLFYIQFVTMSIVNSLRLKRTFTAFDFIIVLSINFLYYIAGMVILTYGNADYKGLFTLLPGLLNLALALVFYRKQTIDRNFVSLLTGLSLLFISLAIPVQFRGNHVVLFWAAESVVLFGLFRRSRIFHLKVASAIVAVLMLVSLLLTWTHVYFSGTDILPVLLNKGFTTGLTAAVALLIYYLLLRKEPDETYLQGITNRSARSLFLVTSLIVAYLAGVWEIFYQFSTRFTYTGLFIVYLQVYSFAVAVVLLLVFKRSPKFPVLKFVLTALCLGMYLFSLGPNHDVSVNLLASSHSSLFTAHWFAAVVLFWLLYDLTRFFFMEKNEHWIAYRSSFTWAAALSIILLLSVEMYHVMLWTSYRDQNDWVWWENLYYKAGLTILWSLCSFTMMWLGMKFRFRTLRIISLSLFLLTALKLFSYDIRNIPPGGKIAAFILLGILLLTVSFMYQRLKKIIIDDTAGQ